MPWIKYNENDSATYPKKDGQYRIKRNDGEFVAWFAVGKGWAFLITMPDFWYSKEKDMKISFSMQGRGAKHEKI